ncbi:MAG: sigma-70 family RNA polymerase sigma factor [Myxococcota bacterium]
MTLTDPDRALVERAQAELPYGTKAFDELIGRHSSRVFARCYAILRSHADAEEASQDVFLAVFRSLPRYQFDRPFSHWLSRVTLNACRMILRRRAAEQRRRDSYEREQPPPEPPPTRDIGLRRVVESLLDELDPGMRVALVMRFVEERGYREIAENLGISESAAKMRVSRGAKRLRQLYEERESAGASGPESGDE